ncbi:MAG: Hint domain-containing protein [Bacteroidia bacterium]
MKHADSILCACRLLCCFLLVSCTNNPAPQKASKAVDSTFISNTGKANVDTKLPTVYAVGNEQMSRVDWPAIRREEEALERSGGGPGFFYYDCARDITSYGSSSVLKPQGSFSYGYSNLTDEDPMTAWVEGSEGFGVGDWFEVVSSGVNLIFNGYQSSISSWENNSRVKKFKVYKNGAPLCYLELMDQMGGQSFSLPGDEAMDVEQKDKYRFVIEDIYSGKKWPDVAISEVMSTGCCFVAGTLLQSPEGLTAIEDLSTYDPIMVYDEQSDAVESGFVKHQVEIRHVTLFELKTKRHSIVLTSDHPLFVKGHGFASLSKMAKIYGVSDLCDLTGRLQLKVWDQSKKGTAFEQLVSIRRIDQPQTTYSILQLDKGNSYIANGFVTRTY